MMTVVREDDDESYHARRDGAGQYQGRMPSLEASLKGLNYYLIENLEPGEDFRVICWVHSSSDNLVLCLHLKGTRPMINEVTDMLHRAPLTTPAILSEKLVHDISRALIVLLSDVFALYLKTKNFHWHMSGSHFRDYHLMLDDQASTQAGQHNRSLDRADFALPTHRGQRC
jgi:hypothetical protein